MPKQPSPPAPSAEPADLTDQQSLENVQFNVHATGMPEFDVLLNGGFPKGATVLLAGQSGSGKTILSTQWLFSGCKHYDEPGLYISLTEPISKLLDHQRSLAFFEQDYIDEKKIQLHDLRIILEHEKLHGTEMLNQDDVWKIVDAIGKLVVESDAKRVVLDSVTALCYRLESKDLIRHFIFSLGTTLAYLDATVFLTSEVAGDGYSVYGVEEFISDVIVKLDHRKEWRDVRELRVVKLRGHGYNPLPAKFDLSEHGIHLYPRIEHGMEHEAPTTRVSTGIAGLDDMTNGGYFEGSTILVSGPSGAGKSILSQHFNLSCLQAGRKSMLISFEESRSEILRNANAFGWDLEQYEQQGLLHMYTVPPQERYLDAHFHAIEQIIQDEKITNVVFDSLSALNSFYELQDVYHTAKQFIAHNKKHGVTTVFTVASSALVGAERNSEMELSTLTDVIIMLRYIEIDSALKHALLILKMRSSEHDRSMHEATFSNKGMTIAETFAGYEGVMSGTAHKVSRSVEEPLYSLFLEMFGSDGEDLFSVLKERGLSWKTVGSLMEELEQHEAITDEQKDEFLERAKKIFHVE